MPVLAIRRRTALAAASLAAGLVLSAPSAARSQDFLTSLQRAFGLPSAQPQPPLPSRSLDASRRQRRARPTGRLHYASLGPPEAAVVGTFAPLPGGPDVSGKVDPAYVAGERKAFETALAGRGGGWMSGRQTMCVRLCDGYAFPVGRLAGPDDLEVHETACRATCPAAATVLFSRPEGAEGMDDAISVGGRRYATLRTAYAHRRTLVPACTCHGAGERAYTPLPIARDRTLRAGDIVMGKSAAFVTMGGGVPGFEDYRRSRTLTKTARLQVQSVVGAEAARPAVRVQLGARADGAALPSPPLPTQGQAEIRVVLPSPY